MFILDIDESNKISSYNYIPQFEPEKSLDEFSLNNSKILDDVKSWSLDVSKSKVMGKLDLCNK